MYQKLLTAAAFAAASAYAQTQEEKDKYPEWARIMDTYGGYTWEAITVKTEDLWNLTMFHITGKVGQGSLVTEATPVLIQHGNSNDAELWVKDSDKIKDAVWPMKLIDQGFDVWMPNNRGSIYSNSNDRDGTWSECERWSFSFAEMATYDQPAFIDKILSETGQEKLTYIGFSQGGSHMIYGLGKNQEYFADRIQRAIIMSPCYAASIP